MSSPPRPAPGPGPAPGTIPASARWRGWPEVRADLRSSLALAAALALAGLPVGLLWWALSPRADFRVTADGPVPVGNPSIELAVADDAVYVLVLATLGLLAGAAAWAMRRRRGVATVVALSMGMTLAALGAWQIGELLGPGPSQAQLADVGAVVTTPLALGGVPALAVGPFAAVLAYLVAATLTRGDDLGRTSPPADRADAPPAGAVDAHAPAEALG